MDGNSVKSNENNNMTEENNKNKVRKVILIILIALFLLGSAAVAYYEFFYLKKDAAEKEIQDESIQNEDETNGIQDELINEEDETNDTQDKTVVLDYVNTICDIEESAENLKMIEKNGLYGVINGTNESIILPAQYDNIHIDYCNETIIVGKNKLFGVFDLDGKQILPIQYELYSQVILGNIFITLVYNGNYAAVIKDGKLGIVNKSGELVIPYRYNLGEFSTEYAIMGEDGEKSLLDDTYVLVFNSIREGEINNFIIRDNNKYGVINSNDKIVIPFEYDRIEYDYSLEYLFAYKDSKMYTFDFNGELVKDWGKLVLYPTHESDGYEYKTETNSVYRTSEDGDYSYCSINQDLTYKCY